MGPYRVISRLLHTRLGYPDLASIMSSEPTRPGTLRVGSTRGEKFGLGPEHPALIAIYNALGNTQTDPADAPAYYEKARALSERVFGPRSLMVAVALANLAELQLFAGDVAEARANYAAAVDIIADTYDGTHPAVAELLGGLAEAQARSGELVTARETYGHIEAIYTQHPEQPNAAHAISGLADTYALEHRWDEALVHYRRANAWMASRTSETPYWFTEGPRGEATALLELGRPAEAATVARRITDHAAEHTRRGVGLTRFVLARALFAMGDRVAALAEAEAALADLSGEHLGVGPAMTEIESWLASVRTATDPPRPPRSLR